MIFRMYFCRTCFNVTLPIFLLIVQPMSGQVSKGHQILLNRGLQIQGLLTPDNYFHLDTYSNANYTSVNLGANSSGNLGPIGTFVGPTPGFPWARWANDETNMPCMGFNDNGVSRTNEIPYTNQLVNLQLADEWNLNDDSVRTRLVNWFLSVKTNWPNTILYHNNYGSQVSDPPLMDFYSRAQPDMLCFDSYPWMSVYDINLTNHTGATIPGPPTSWYGDLRRYRAHASTSGIPLGIYRQTFHAVQDYDGHVFRDPSSSELRLLTFAGLAFNVKLFTDFVYNPGANSFFTNSFNGAGDSQTNTSGLFAELTDMNKRARNLGRALTGLKPIYDLHNPNDPSPPPGPVSGDVTFPDGKTTSILYMRGKSISGGVTNFSSVPIGLLADPDVAPSNPAGTGQSYSWWEFAKNDPYLRGWAVTNKAAVKNDRLTGDAILSWFTPLDESLDGTNFNNEIYMMVVNGLTSPDGTAANCMQQIRLNFTDTAVTSSVLLLDTTTGLVTTNALPIVSTRRQLAVDLNGGDAVLFKFNTGAPFVGFVTPTPAQLTVQRQSGNAVVSINGALGARYQLEAASSLTAPNWTPLTIVVLATSPYVFVEKSDAAMRYYRAVGLQ